MSADTYDVLVIGSGAAGGALSWRLTEKGAKVLCLEQGGWIDPNDFPSARVDYESQFSRGGDWLFSPNLRNRPEDYPVATSGSFPQEVNMFNAVGGTTIHWQGLFPRFHPSDFRVRTLDGVADDWPIDYWELEPYYDLNEHMIGISGLDGDPANPPRQHQTPPLPLGKVGRTMARAFDSLGWHWWVADQAIISQPYRHRPACMLHGKCMFGCPMGSKASTDRTYWPLAIEKGAELRPWSRVREITLNPKGKASGALYYDKEGVLQSANARVVVVCCNGVGTPRLLLNSKSKLYPDGLGNTHGMVGKNYMNHPIRFVSGVFDDPMDGHLGPMGAPLWSQEFYETDSKRPFKRGYSLIVERTFGPLNHALGGNRSGKGVSWGKNHHREFAELFPHSIGISVFADDLPEVSNTVTLDEQLTDSNGIPAPKVTYELGENSRMILEHGTERAKEVLVAAGAKKVTDVGYFNMAHLLGTARMGTHPNNSVVNADNQVHQVANLFAVDGSSFTTGAAVNPTATIMALALRAADKIWDRRKEFS